MFIGLNSSSSLAMLRNRCGHGKGQRAYTVSGSGEEMKFEDSRLEFRERLPSPSGWGARADAATEVRRLTRVRGNNEMRRNPPEGYVTRRERIGSRWHLDPSPHRALRGKHGDGRRSYPKPISISLIARPRRRRFPVYRVTRAANSEN